eukprot:scaffold1837_cov391-Prasinococcus_capsulatus_cf.AAC.9
MTRFEERSRHSWYARTQLCRYRPHYHPQFRRMAAPPSSKTLPQVSCSCTLAVCGTPAVARCNPAPPAVDIGRYGSPTLV